MKKNKNQNTFDEQYLVKINYKKPDGYWVYGAEIDIDVPVVHGVNEKNNHKKAEKLTKKLYPNCKIVSVSYC